MQTFVQNFNSLFQNLNGQGVCLGVLLSAQVIISYFNAPLPHLDVRHIYFSSSTERRFVIPTALSMFGKVLV